MGLSRPGVGVGVVTKCGVRWAFGIVIVARRTGLDHVHAGGEKLFSIGGNEPPSAVNLGDAKELGRIISGGALGEAAQDAGYANDP